MLFALCFMLMFIAGIAAVVFAIQLLAGKIRPNEHVDYEKSRKIVKYSLAAAAALFVLCIITVPKSENRGDDPVVEQNSRDEAAEAAEDSVPEDIEELSQKTAEEAVAEKTEKEKEETAEVSDDAEVDDADEASEREEVEAATAENAEGRRDETLNGRGRADSGRSEPQYVGVIGYAAVASDQEYKLNKSDDFANEDLWMIPTYRKDKQFWEETGTMIPHKTEVVVKEQELEHSGFGAYHGYLLVEETVSGEQYYIDAINYVTKPYWTYDVKEAAKTGYFVAEFRQTSDFYPVDNGGEKTELDDGVIVLVTGRSGTTSKYKADDVPIETTVWKQWRYGYGGVTIHFNEDDLTMVY